VAAAGAGVLLLPSHLPIGFSAGSLSALWTALLTLPPLLLLLLLVRL